MQPFDDLLPIETDRANADLIAFLRQSHDLPIVTEAEPEPQQQELALASVRQRLLAMRQEQREESTQKPALRLLAPTETPEVTALPLPEKTLPARKSGWRRSFALLAATLLAALVVGSLLTVFTLAKQNSQGKHGQVTGESTRQQSIYLCEGGWVQKIDVKTGQLTWKYQIPGLAKMDREYAKGYIVVENTIVYVTIAQHLFALQARDGTALWHVDLNGLVATQPVIQNDVLYLAVYIEPGSSAVEALNASSGSRIWQYTQYSDAGEMADIQVLDGVVYGSLTLQGLTPNTKIDSYLFAVRSKDGSQLWKVHSAITTGSIGHMTVVNGHLYVTGTMTVSRTVYHQYVYAYNASNGAFLWHSTILDFGLSSPLVVQGTLYLIADEGLFAFDPQNGRLLWQYTRSAYMPLPAQEPSDNPSDSISIQNGTIFLIGLDEAYNDVIIELNASNGKLIAHHRIENFNNVRVNQPIQTPGTKGNGKAPESMVFSMFASYVVSNDVSYVATSNGTLDALSNQTGVRLWSARLAGATGLPTLILAP